MGTDAAMLEDPEDQSDRQQLVDKLSVSGRSSSRSKEHRHGSGAESELLQSCIMGVMGIFIHIGESCLREITYERVIRRSRVDRHEPSRCREVGNPG